MDSYARVIAMIEIEVEMDADLPAAEVLGERVLLPRCALAAASHNRHALLGSASPQLSTAPRACTSRLDAQCSTSLLLASIPRCHAMLACSTLGRLRSPPWPTQASNSRLRGSARSRRCRRSGRYR